MKKIIILPVIVSFVGCCSVGRFEARERVIGAKVLEEICCAVRQSESGILLSGGIVVVESTKKEIDPILLLSLRNISVNIPAAKKDILFAEELSMTISKRLEAWQVSSRKESQCCGKTELKKNFGDGKRKTNIEITGPFENPWKVGEFGIIVRMGNKDNPSDWFWLVLTKDNKFKALIPLSIFDY